MGIQTATEGADVAIVNGTKGQIRWLILVVTNAATDQGGGWKIQAHFIGARDVVAALGCPGDQRRQSATSLGRAM